MNNNILSYNNENFEKTKIETEASDKETFVKLVQDNRVSLYRLAISIVKNKDETEDVISETKKKLKILLENN
ncbi:MAG TPA: hypothetical protein VIK72_18290 [Clostridiaceae bacterium]